MKTKITEFGELIITPESSEEEFILHSILSEDQIFKKEYDVTDKGISMEFSKGAIIFNINSELY